MSKYGSLARTTGHSQWFLQRTLKEHDQSMDHPWMKMICAQSFTISQYAAWLALSHAVFQALERHADEECLAPVRDARLLRSAALEADLAQLLGAGWRQEAAAMVEASPAAARALEGVAADARAAPLLLAQHFLQYNAVLSGGAYLGKMVSEKLCVPHGAPGVRFYAFEDVDQGKGPARVQQYLKEFDKIELDAETRDKLLVAMKRIYAESEAMMSEVYDLNPAEVFGHSTAKETASTKEGAPAPMPVAEQLELGLEELQGYTGAEGGRILLSLAGELLDVSAGRDIYGPGGSYSLLAGHDVTRCLATMCLEPAGLDDLEWEADNAEDEAALAQWREKLLAKYPVAGRLKPGAAPQQATGDKRRAKQADAKAGAPAAEAADAAGGADASQKCPISGKEGAGCPMSMFMGNKGGAAAPKAQAAPAAGKPQASSGFTAGKSLVASVEKASGWEDSWLYRLCPLHWDDATVRAFAFVAAASWCSGVFVGWNLHRQLVAA